MTPRQLIEKLAPFKGKMIKDCIDEISSIAIDYTINIMDPTFNTLAIDNESNRLNVKIDNNSIITSFTIG